jgi:SPP1 gp7 family putative phage head morphogenesis protein
VADLPDLRALFGLAPEAAAAYLRDKGMQLTGPYWELDGPAHSRVFTVANLAQMDVLTDIRRAVQMAMDDGTTERWFARELVGTLQRKGWWGPAIQVDPDTMEARIVQQGCLRRLQTIYRTNLQSAYAAGRHRQALEQGTPYGQYLSVPDSRRRPSHAALHGRVFRVDSPAWAIIAPTNGYNCRCRARYFSERELRRRGLEVETDIRIIERPAPIPPADRLTGESPPRILQRGISVPSRTGHGREVLLADLGWDHLPGSDGAERAIVDRLMERAADLGDGVRELVLAGLAAEGIVP